MKTDLKLLVFTFMALISPSAAFLHRQPPSLPAQTTSLDVELSWLPADTETIVVLTKAGKLLGEDPKRRLSVRVLCPELASVGLPSFLAPELHGGEKYPPLSYEFIVDGSRKYRGPSGFGIGTYEGCKIVGLAPSELSRVKLLIEKMAANKVQVGGLSTYVLTETIEKDKWKFFICFSENLMFCATDRQFLNQVLDRRAGKASRVAMPESLEQWRYVEKSVSFWAVRQFPPGVNWEGVLYDDKLTGYTVSLDKGETKMSVVSLSKNLKGYEIATGFWSDFLKREGKITPLEMKRINEHATKIVLDASSPNGQIPIFVLFAILGHPILV
jgi:hypothetical protein